MSIELDALSKNDQEFVMAHPCTDIGVYVAEYKEGEVVLGRCFGLDGLDRTDHKSTSLASLSPPVQDGLCVLLVIPNTPAFKAGIRKWDIIGKVDGKREKLGCFAYRANKPRCAISVYRQQKNDQLGWTELSLLVPALPVAEIAATVQSHDVTIAQYEMIEKGMTEKEVEEILGFPGTASTTAGGDKFAMKSVTWKKKVSGSIPKSITIIFLDGKVEQKTVFRALSEALKPRVTQEC